ncbi:aminotransferase class I/II-fold pyridoxal phosphate-dependent enzyme [Weissella confusa]|uniref:aminotransferase class I/II-fold pyridoxal phosphate-dependent enzyme n=2 Tax=Weissella confusa TaxID=1583 RepID=UPI0022DFE634|nr:aminotransferase class I/II-fold pyridoxal phosphate-dependent enzyme [Weissella confusa]
MPHMKATLANRLNQDLKKIQPNEIRAFDMQVSQIPDIIKLTLGEPDFDTPEVVKQAAIDSIANNDSHYAPGNGTVAVRQAAAHFLSDRYDLQYDPMTEIAVTVGATEAIYASLTAVLNPGDKVLIPTPTFPLYDPITLMNGGEPVHLDTSATDFVLTPEMLSAAIAEHGDAIKAIILNYPGNPTGVAYSSKQLLELAAVLADTDIIVIADEIYSELAYDSEHRSIATYLPEQTLVLNGVSKSHAMTGYRIGFIAGPAELMRTVGMVHQMTVTTPSNPAMAAATVALGTEAGRRVTLEMKSAYRKRRDYVVAQMRRAGFKVMNPDGAFYVYAGIPETHNTNDREFALALAENAAVAVIPGSVFGPGGEGYIRLSYATSDAQLQEAMARIQNYMQQVQEVSE